MRPGPRPVAPAVRFIPSMPLSNQNSHTFMFHARRMRTTVTAHTGIRTAHLKRKGAYPERAPL